MKKRRVHAIAKSKMKNYQSLRPKCVTRNHALRTPLIPLEDWRKRGSNDKPHEARDYCYSLVDLEIILYLSFKGLQKWYILESKLLLF